MNRNERKFKKLLKKCENVTVHILTEKEFLLINPGSTHSDYGRKYGFPDLGERIDLVDDALGGDYDGTVDFVVIDEKYNTWLRKNGKDESEDSQLEYAESLDRPAIQSLWKEHPEFSTAYFSGALLLCLAMPTCFPSKCDFSISDEKRKIIQDCLSKQFGEGNVWVSRQVSDVNDYLGDGEESFRNDAMNYFLNGQNTRKMRYDFQESKDHVTGMFVCVPFVVRQNLDCTVELSTWFEDAYVKIMSDGIPEDFTVDSRLLDKKDLHQVCAGMYPSTMLEETCRGIAEQMRKK